MTSKKNILVTGANGQVGMEFRSLAESFDAFDFLFVSRNELSIEDSGAVLNYFSENHIDICINCAAYTAVDKAETERELAMAINATAVGNLASVCAKHGSEFIHFSTDYVFNGTGHRPYLETDDTDPVNFYGLTKLNGEKLALQNNPQSILIRTSWVYSRYGKNFVKTMQRLFRERDSVGVVADQFGCPTYASDLATAVMQILTTQNFLPGIYHYANEGVISWHEFATAIKKIEKSPCIVKPLASSEYPTPAARPAYSAFDTNKIASTFSLKINDWRDSLHKCLNAEPL